MKLKYIDLDIDQKGINDQEYSLKAVFSTGDIDRHGEIVDQKGWNLADFSRNPVLLFSHDHSQPPVGKVMNIGYNEEGNLEGDVKFAAKEYPFAEVIWNLYKGGFMKAFSVGFSSGKADEVNGRTILRDNTLYEISTVSVPANAMALAKTKGIDVSALETKMDEIASEEVKHEETCETKDIEVKDCEPCKRAQEERQREHEAAVQRAEEEQKGEEEQTPAPSQEEVEETIEEIPAETEEKGAVADAVVEYDVMEQKYQNMDQISNITCALWSVYMDDTVPLDAFKSLVTETASLLLSVADNSSSADVNLAYEGLIKKFLEQGISEETAKSFLEKITSRMTPPVTPVEEKKEEIKIEEPKSVNKTVLSIKVETPKVRMTIPAGKKAGKASLINKAVRALLAEKRKIK